MNIETGLTIVKLIDIQNVAPNRELGDLKRLKDSINELGMIHNLVIDTEYNLVAGRRRYRALLELGITKANVLVVDITDPTHAFKIMLHENTRRKPLTDPEQSLMVKEFHEMQQALVAESFAENKPQTSVEPKPIEQRYWSQEDTANALGTSQPVIAKAIKIAEAVEEQPDLGRLKGKQILREINLNQQREQIEQEVIERPDGKFHVIVCDPPWKNYGGEYDPSGRRGVPPYPTMETEDIKNLKIPAADDCVLWLWSLNYMMKEAFEVVEAWGFIPKSVLTWVKPHIGLGRWLRGQTEHCILAVKGSVPWKIGNESTVLFADRREHSRKPDEFYTMLDKISVGRKLDMFSRESRVGWDQYGDETSKFTKEKTKV